MTTERSILVSCTIMAAESGRSSGTARSLTRGSREPRVILVLCTTMATEFAKTMPNPRNGFAKAAEQEATGAQAGLGSPPRVREGGKTLPKPRLRESETLPHVGLLKTAIDKIRSASLAGVRQAGLAPAF